MGDDRECREVDHLSVEAKVGCDASMNDLIHPLKLVVDSHSAWSDPVAEILLYFPEDEFYLFKSCLLADEVGVLGELEEEVLVSAFYVDTLKLWIIVLIDNDEVRVNLYAAVLT